MGVGWVVGNPTAVQHGGQGGPGPTGYAQWVAGHLSPPFWASSSALAMHATTPTPREEDGRRHGREEEARGGHPKGSKPKSWGGAALRHTESKGAPLALEAAREQKCLRRPSLSTATCAVPASASAPPDWWVACGAGVGRGP